MNARPTVNEKHAGILPKKVEYKKRRKNKSRRATPQPARAALIFSRTSLREVLHHNFCAAAALAALCTRFPPRVLRAGFVVAGQLSRALIEQGISSAGAPYASTSQKTSTAQMFGGNIWCSITGCCKCICWSVATATVAFGASAIAATSPLQYASQNWRLQNGTTGIVHGLTKFSLILSVAKRCGPVHVQG